LIKDMVSSGLLHLYPLKIFGEDLISIDYIVKNPYLIYLLVIKTKSIYIKIVI